VSTTAEGTKHAIDAVSVFTVIGTLSDALPPLAALFTILWTGLRIYESDTVQGILGKKKDEDDQ
jgi:hypothetical protein